MNSRPLRPLFAESIVFDQPGLSAGVLECRPQHPDFSDLGPTSRYVVAFPTAPILLTPTDGGAFAGSPGTAVTMHRTQRVLRDAIAPAGDRCFWIGFDDATAWELADATGNRCGSASFLRFQSFGVDVPPRLYIAARRLQQMLQGDAADPRHTEEQLLDLAARVLQLGVRRPSSGVGARRRARRSDAELVHEVRRFVLQQPTRALDVTGIASRFDVTTFRLARAFRSVTGSTLTQFSITTRILLSTAHLDRDHHLSALAQHFGFASHSHYSSWFTRLLGVTPSQYRGRKRMASGMR